MSSDSGPRIETVNKENERKHRKRWNERHAHKAWQKAKDRRKNFEKGEFAGFLYCMGLMSLVLASTDQLNNYPLALWQRLLIALLGAICLTGKTYTKRRFWKQTEDAEYQKEEQDNGNS
jgi:hypothetical protein